MGRISEKFGELREKGRAALVIYVTAGAPAPARTLSVLKEMEKAGADIIELGVPFSDPVADGPVIQLASRRALDGGMTLARALGILRRFRRFSELPVVVFSYYNPIYKMGARKFLKKAAAAGADGVLVVDLSPEEAEGSGFLREARASGLDVIMLVAPTSPDGRIMSAARLGGGFVYAVSLTGVTGARKSLPAELASFVRRVKKLSRKPVAVGFGVSGPKMAREVARFADGVVVGSAVVKLLLETGSPARAGRFVRSMASALKGAGRRRVSY